MPLCLKGWTAKQELIAEHPKTPHIHTAVVVLQGATHTDEQWGVRWRPASCQRRRAGKADPVCWAGSHITTCLCNLCTRHALLSKQRVARLPLYPSKASGGLQWSGKALNFLLSNHANNSIQCTIPSTRWTAGKAKVSCQAP